MTYIPLTDCIKGHVYLLHSRNLSLGVYDGSNGFIGIREKFNSFYLFTEYHWDQGAPYGTVKPERDVGVLPADIPIDTDFCHSKGDLWAYRGLAAMPVVRRDLLAGEALHGTRMGFVDLWADTGERLPDLIYPFSRENKALFRYLENFKISS